MAPTYGQPRDPRRLEREAEHYERLANAELDDKKRDQMRRLAADLRRQAKDAYRPRA